MPFSAPLEDCAKNRERFNFWRLLPENSGRQNKARSETSPFKKASPFARFAWQSLRFEVPNRDPIQEDFDKRDKKKHR
jgi:hypothetical protein